MESGTTEKKKKRSIKKEMENGNGENGSDSKPERKRAKVTGGKAITVYPCIVKSCKSDATVTKYFPEGNVKLHYAQVKTCLAHSKTSKSAYCVMCNDKNGDERDFDTICNICKKICDKQRSIWTKTDLSAPAPFIRNDRAQPPSDHSKPSSSPPRRSSRIFQQTSSNCSPPPPPNPPSPSPSPPPSAPSCKAFFDRPSSSSAKPRPLRAPSTHPNPSLQSPSIYSLKSPYRPLQSTKSHQSPSSSLHPSPPLQPPISPPPSSLLAPSTFPPPSLQPSSASPQTPSTSIQPPPPSLPPQTQFHFSEIEKNCQALVAELQKETAKVQEEWEKINKEKDTHQKGAAKLQQAIAEFTKEKEIFEKEKEKVGEYGEKKLAEKVKENEHEKRQHNETRKKLNALSEELNSIKALSLIQGQVPVKKELTDRVQKVDNVLSSLTNILHNCEKHWKSNDDRFSYLPFWSVFSEKAEKRFNKSSSENLSEIPSNLRDKVAECLGSASKPELSTLVFSRTIKLDDPRGKIGEGLFALNAIPKDTILGLLSGKVWLEDELLQMPEYVFHSWKYEKYIFEIPADSENFVLESANQGNELRLINDPCINALTNYNESHCISKPNVKFAPIVYKGKPYILAYTLEHIPQQAELLAYYGKKYWEGMNTLTQRHQAFMKFMKLVQC